MLLEKTAESKQQGSSQGIKRTDEKKVSGAIVDKRITRDEINAVHMDKSASYTISTTTLPVSANLERPRFIL